MKTLKDLVLAMVNATLILVAVCLFLLWQVSGAAERIVASFAQNLEVLQPLKERVTEMRDEVAGLRRDLQTLPTDGTARTEFTTKRLQTRADALQSELMDINESLQKLADTPDRLMTQAVDQLAAKAGVGASGVLSCLTPDPNSGV